MLQINTIIKELIKMQKINWDDAKYFIDLQKKKLGETNILHIFQLIQNSSLSLKLAIKLAEIQSNLIDMNFITVQEIEFINKQQEEQAGCGYFIFKLIQNELLTFKDVVNLNEDESYQLSDQNIIELIIKNIITIEKVFKLEDYQLDALSSANIFLLLEEGYITIEKVLELTEEQCDKLIYNVNLINHIIKKKITLQEILQLTKSKTKYLEELIPLIENGCLSTEQALSLTDDECYHLLHNKHNLISKIYTVENILDALKKHKEHNSRISKNSHIEAIMEILVKKNVFTKIEGEHLIKLQKDYLGEDTIIFYLIKEGYFIINIQYAIDLIELQSELLKNNRITQEEVNLITGKNLINVYCRVYIFKLIKYSYITVQEAINLNDQQISYLSNKNIFQLIMDHFIAVEEVLQLNDLKIENLSEDYICELICNHDLSIQRAKNLTDEEYCKLDSLDIIQLIKGKYITCEEIMKLKIQQVDNLKGFSCSLIKEGYLTIAQAIDLSKYQYYSLSISYPLLKNKVITLETAVNYLKIDNDLEKLIDEIVPIDNQLNINDNKKEEQEKKAAESKKEEKKEKEHEREKGELREKVKEDEIEKGEKGKTGEKVVNKTELTEISKLSLENLANESETQKQHNFATNKHHTHQLHSRNKLKLNI